MTPGISSGLPGNELGTMAASLPVGESANVLRCWEAGAPSWNPHRKGFFSYSSLVSCFLYEKEQHRHWVPFWSTAPLCIRLSPSLARDSELQESRHCASADLCPRVPADTTDTVPANQTEAQSIPCFHTRWSVLKYVETLPPLHSADAPVGPSHAGTKDSARTSGAGPGICVMEPQNGPLAPTVRTTTLGSHLWLRSCASESDKYSLLSKFTAI